MSEIPKGWVETEISKIGEVVAGGTPSTKEPSFWGNEINWISPSDLTGYTNKTISKGAKNLTRLGLKNSSAKVMPKGSIHFSSRAPIGYVVISSEDLSTNQGFKSLVPANGINSEYVYYYLKSAKQLAEKVATGTTFKEISGTAFGKLPIPLPPSNEQKWIVDKIEELFSELDKGIESLKTAREQLKIYRQSVLKHAFEGKLTENWRKENNIPFDWESEKIGDLFTLNPKHKDVDDDLEISFVPMPALNQDTARIDVHEPKKFGQVKKGYTHFANNDVLFAKITPCMENGKNGLATDLINGIGCGSTEFIVFRAKEKILPEFLLMKFRDTHFRRVAEANMTGAVGQRRVPKTWIENQTLPVPSKPEQEKIISIVNDLYEKTSIVENEINENLKKSEALRQSILKSAFSGKLVAQDPNDEPASVLLERIKAEQANTKRKKS